MKIRFKSISSGSCGNCYYVGTDGYGFLIDAGISFKSIKIALRNEGIAFETVYAIFVTHDHADHIKSLESIALKSRLPIYTTQLVHEGIARSYCSSGKIPADCIKFVEKDVPFKFRDFVITPFEVPHDGTDNVGYCIEAGDKTFCILTDLGHITPHAASYIERANYLVLESNYEEQMLLDGKYPPYLKQRIMGPNGHMSNSDTARFLAQNFNEKLQYVWLCHLSEENNHPELAYKAVEMEMRSYGIIPGKDVQVVVLKRSSPSDMYVFE